jgi:heme oxygenase
LLLHEALEDELAAHAETRDFFTPDMARTDALRGDLAALGADEVDIPLGETLQLAELIRAWAAEAPWKLFGALYVFEGSRMGSMFLVRPVARALGVPVEPGQGIDYHLDGIERRPQTWAAFKTRLNQLPLTDRQWDEVVAAASQTMDGLHELYAALSGQFVCVVNS